MRTSVQRNTVALAELDEPTLRRAAEGDDDARLLFVQRYQRVVFAAISRVLGRTSNECEDIAQECFLRALQALPRFDPSRGVRVSTWISTIAIRAAIDQARKQVRLVSLDAMHDAESTLVIDAPDAEFELDATRRREKLSAAMKTLTPEHRAVVLLRFEQELSLEQIAKELGVEVGTVKSRISRAKDALTSAIRTTMLDREGTT